MYRRPTHKLEKCPEDNRCLIPISKFSKCSAVNVCRALHLIEHAHALTRRDVREHPRFLLHVRPDRFPPVVRAVRDQYHRGSSPTAQSSFVSECPFHHPAISRIWRRMPPEPRRQWPL